MIQRYAILLLLFVPAVVGGQERGSSNSRIVAQADTTSIHVPLTLAQQDAGTAANSIDTHDLSKKLGGAAVLALIVLVVILAVRGKKAK
jgi:hypothetical protein